MEQDKRQPDLFDQASIIPVPIWNAVVEEVAIALDGGAAIADAIQAGLKHLRESGWYKKATTQVKRIAERDVKAMELKEVGKQVNTATGITKPVKAVPKAMGSIPSVPKRRIAMIEKNPFNVLGLLAGTPEKNLAKRRAQINAYLKVGRSIAFDEDIAPATEGIDRSEDSITKAFAAIDQYASRARHGFFWFVDGGRADGAALAHLRSGDVEKARDIWYRVSSTGDLTEQTISSASNLGTLSFLTGAGDMEALAIGLNWKVKVLDSPLLPQLLERIGNASTAKDAQGFIAAWAAELTGWLFPVHGDSPADMQKLAASMDRANEPVRSLLKSPIEEHYAKEVERFVGECEKRRKADKPNAHQAALKLLGASKAKLDTFKAFAGANSMAYQHAADEVAEALLQCSIDHWNAHFDKGTIDTKTVTRVMAQTKAWAVGKPLVARIQENWATMQEYIDDEPERVKQARNGETLSMLRPIIEKFDPEQAGMKEIQKFLTLCQHPLGLLAKALGTGDQLYVNTSSTIVGKAQAALVRNVNDAQSRASISFADQWSFRQVIADAMALTDQLDRMAMNVSLREQFDKNRSVLRDIASRLSISPSAVSRPVVPRSPISSPTAGPQKPVAQADPSWLERNIVAIIVFVLVGIALYAC